MGISLNHNDAIIKPRIKNSDSITESAKEFQVRQLKEMADKITKAEADKIKKSSEKASTKKSTKKAETKEEISDFRLSEKGEKMLDFFTENLEKYEIGLNEAEEKEEDLRLETLKSVLNLDETNQ